MRNLASVDRSEAVERDTRSFEAKESGEGLEMFSECGVTRGTDSQWAPRERLLLGESQAWGEEPHAIGTAQ